MFVNQLQGKNLTTLFNLLCDACMRHVVCHQVSVIHRMRVLTAKLCVLINCSGLPLMWSPLVPGLCGHIRGVVSSQSGDIYIIMCNIAPDFAVS